MRKLEKYAELESWSEREKLVQLELRLKGQAERLYKVLPTESKTSFSSAVESLKKRLTPARRDALLSAQLRGSYTQKSENFQLTGFFAYYIVLCIRIQLFNAELPNYRFESKYS